jgi:hypothetical protein
MRGRPALPRFATAYQEHTVATTFSKITNLNHLRIHPLPKGKVITGEIIQCDGCHIVRTKDGAFYATGHLAKRHTSVRVPTQWGHSRSLMDCFLKLGMVSKEVVEENNRRLVSEAKGDKARGLLQYHAKELAELGVPLTKAQRAKLEKIAALSPRADEWAN